MKVLMLTTNGSLMDGINRHILMIAPALNKLSGVEAGVCIVHPQGELHEALEKSGVKVWSLGYPNGHKPGVYFGLKKVIKEFRPDIVHSHVMALMERVMLARKYKELKYVTTIHGIGDAMLAENNANITKISSKKSLKVRVEEWVNRRYKIKFSACCYISRGVREKLLSNDKFNKFTPVCYNPMSFKNQEFKTHVLHDLIGVGHDIPIIGTACRIYEVKNPEAFTEVMCRALVKCGKAHAVILGDGSQELIQKCREIVGRFNVAERFHFLGYRQDGPQLVADLTCFVMTSKSEGMPTAVLEGFAGKVPIAMLRGEGGLRDIDFLNTADKPIVTITDKDDLEGLAKGIALLIDNPRIAEAQAENAFDVAKANFDLDVVTTQLHDLYKLVISER